MSNTRSSRSINAYQFNPARELYVAASRAFRVQFGGNPWAREAKKLRELWEISKFGVGFGQLRGGPIEVRLIDEEPADGQIRFGSEVVDLQTTVVNRQGRAPDREYRERKKSKQRGRFSPEATEEQTNEWIAQAVAAKEGKRYARSRPLYLIVHANFRKNGLDIRGLVERVTRIGPSSFDEVWLLTGIIGPGDSFAIVRLFPDPNGRYLLYNIASEKTLNPQDLDFPFGPMEIRDNRPV